MFKFHMMLEKVSKLSCLLFQPISNNLYVQRRGEYVYLWLVDVLPIDMSVDYSLEGVFTTFKVERW